MVANEQDNSERIIRLETQFDSLSTVLLRIESKLDARDEKYILREQQIETFRLRDERARELEKKTDDMVLKLEKKCDTLQAKIEANDAAISLKFKEIEQEKKTVRRSFPDLLSSILQSAVIIVGVILYLTHK